MTTTQRTAMALERVVDLHGRLYKLVRQTHRNEWMAIGLTMPQFKTLLHLWSVGPSRMADLANEVGIRMSVASGIADRLEGLKLVERRPVDSDGRGVSCALTVEGQRLISNLTQTRAEVFHIIAEQLSAEQLQLVGDAAELLLSTAERSLGASADFGHSLGAKE